MVQQGAMTQFQRFRMVTGMLVIALALMWTGVRADDVPYMPWECRPEQWGWWVDLFGETLAGYMRWLTCATYGLP